LSVSQFEARLANACRSEQRTADNTMARILALRGDGNASAHARQTGEEVRQGMVADYRRVIELEPQLKAFAAMCKANPEQCRE
jgi:bacterioferritin (cytochrome b1)